MICKYIYIYEYIYNSLILQQQSVSLAKGCTWTQVATCRYLKASAWWYSVRWSWTEIFWVAERFKALVWSVASTTSSNYILHQQIQPIKPSWAFYVSFDIDLQNKEFPCLILLTLLRSSWCVAHPSRLVSASQRWYRRSCAIPLCAWGEENVSLWVILVLLLVAMASNLIAMAST